MRPAGKRDRRIRFERMVATSTSASGEPTKIPIVVARSWAAVLSATGTELFRAQQRVAEISAGWALPWDPVVAAITPSEDYRVVDAAERIFDIVSITEEGRRDGLLVFGKARAE